MVIIKAGSTFIVCEASQNEVEYGALSGKFCEVGVALDIEMRNIICNKMLSVTFSYMEIELL